MEKYATYLVFQNTETKEIKRIPVTENEQDEELVKIAELKEWIQLDTDPEDTWENNCNESQIF